MKNILPFRRNSGSSTTDSDIRSNSKMSAVRQNSDSLTASTEYESKWENSPLAANDTSSSDHGNPNWKASATSKLSRVRQWINEKVTKLKIISALRKLAGPAARGPK